jgi:hypothetical protein
LEDLGIDERVILKLILKKWIWRAWTEFIWLRIGESDGTVMNPVRNLWAPSFM